MPHPMSVQCNKNYLIGPFRSTRIEADTVITLILGVKHTNQATVIDGSVYNQVMNFAGSRLEGGYVRADVARQVP